MTLRAYRTKRRFEATTEPRGSRTSPRFEKRRFVIQRHAARRLHFDLRLELDGVLKSWAVPKGIGTAKGDRRLAIHVEDHPIEYATFEGEIPKGEYGAGQVEIWDEGYWEPLTDKPREDYQSGKLRFRLHGRRVDGEWVLVRTRMGEEEKKENWLLISRGTQKNRPLLARRQRSLLPDGAVEAEFLQTATPELAVSVREIPRSEEWLHEIKLDGYRILGFVDYGRVRILTRNGLDWTEKFSSIVAALKKTFSKQQVVVDGEVVAFDENGVSRFQLLQGAIHSNRSRGLDLVLFDILYWDGYDLRPCRLEDRKRLLENLLSIKSLSARIRFSTHVTGDPKSLFSEVCRRGLEGLVSKKRHSSYIGRRSRDWIKIKCLHRQEFVIGGYTDPQNTRLYFGALLLGYYAAGRQGGNRLRYAGRVGTGFDDRTLLELGTRMQKLRQEQSPFENLKKGKGMNWLKPMMVGEISFSEWTDEGMLRQPSFLGIRDDKAAEEVVRE